MSTMDPANEEQVVLVDTDDQEVGTMSKSRAHREGRLHRAFSIFIFNSQGRLLLQRRAKDKYHSGGLWTNSCCSHPRPGEPIGQAAARRLKEELGIDCDLSPEFTFTYRAEVGGGLIEHEFDHVLFGTYDGPVEPDESEVSDVRWMRMDDLGDDLRTYGERYTAWLNVCWPRIWERFTGHRRA
jgi:isopentenyl-diphosphate delta-isomerase